MTNNTNIKPLLKYYRYYQNYTKEYGLDIYTKTLPIINKHCQRYQFNMYGKNIISNRKSCVYSDNSVKLYNIGYKQTPIYNWGQSPIQITILKKSLEFEFKTKINYVLVHIYEHRNDYIGWHNDKESMNNSIFSLSFGMPRNFQINKKKVLISDQKIMSGDLIIMDKGFQQEYKHRVPKISYRDYKQFIESKGYLTKGKRSFDSLDDIVVKNNIDTKRINFTFRSFD